MLVPEATRHYILPPGPASLSTHLQLVSSQAQAVRVNFRVLHCEAPVPLI